MYPGVFELTELPKIVGFREQAVGRIEKLESELAALRAELAACVRTRRVEVVDADGNVYAVLVAFNAGASLRLFDGNSKSLASLDAHHYRPSLCLYDESGNPRVKLAVNDNKPVLLLRGENDPPIPDERPLRDGSLFIED